MKPVTKILNVILVQRNEYLKELGVWSFTKR